MGKCGKTMENMVKTWENVAKPWKNGKSTSWKRREKPRKTSGNLGAHKENLRKKHWKPRNNL
jgi:hypothetical protein